MRPTSARMSAVPARRQETDLATLERFYQCLLALTDCAQVEPVLDDALHVIAELSQARVVYVEIFDDQSNPKYWRGYVAGTQPLPPIREQVSTGILQEAIKLGTPVETASAVHDRRFAELTSVRQHDIGPVICIPVCLKSSTTAVYVQGHSAFSDIDRRRIDLFARRIARVAHRVPGTVATTRPTLGEEIQKLKRRRVREALERHDSSVSEAARELGVGRAFIYKILGRSP